MEVIPKAGEVFHSDDGTVSVVLPDVCDTDSEPTQEELHEYAEWLGIDVEKEPHLLWIASKGLRTPLPMGWKACRTDEGEVYYFNFLTGDSRWENPLDDVFRRKLDEERTNTEGGKGNSNTFGRKNCGSSKSLSESFQSSSVVSERKGGEEATEAQRIEKSLAGHADSAGGRAKNTLSTPTPAVSTSKTFMSTGMMTLPTSNMRFGRLGALGTPEAARRITPDVSNLLSSSKVVPALTRFGGGNGLSGGGLGRQTKAFDGVREMEVQIRQRIDEDIDARRRAMRLRIENRLAEERAALDAELQKAAHEGERELLENEKQQEMVAQQAVQVELDAVQQTLEKQHAEAKERAVALSKKLQQEHAGLNIALQQRLAEAREKLRVEHVQAERVHCEESAAALQKERARLSEEYARQLDDETQRSARYAQTSSEGLQKKLNAVKAQLEKRLIEKSEAATANLRADKLAEAQRVYEKTIQQASSEAAAALDTLRSEYSTKIEKLQSEKEEALRRATATAVLAGADTNTVDGEAVDAPKKQSESKEQHLMKGLEERLAEYANETQRMVEARRAELGVLCEQQKQKPSIETDGGGSLSGTGVGSSTREWTTLAKEQQRFELASRNLEAQHVQNVEKMHREHEQMLSERKLFNPRKDPQFIKKFKEMQNSWIEMHPTPSYTMPLLKSVPASVGLLNVPPAPMPSETEQREHINAAVAAATEQKENEFEQQLVERKAVLEKEMQMAMDAYRERRIQEVRRKLSLYKEAQAADLQRRLEDAAASIAEEELPAQPSHDAPSMEEIPSQVDEITMEEAARREENLKQRLEVGISSLQAAIERAHAQLRHLREEVQVKSAVAGERPPPVPTVTSPFGRQWQQLTPRSFQPQYHNQQQKQHGSSVLLSSSAWSTIPPVNSLVSSAQASPRSKLHSNETINSAVMGTACYDSNDLSLQDRSVMCPTSCAMPQKQNALFEDRLRRAALLLQEKRDELRAQQACMKRARKMWLQDMEDCRNQRDHDQAVMLRQIKVALEKKARQLNRDVIDLKQAYAWLREREVQHKRHSSSSRVLHLETGSSNPAGAANDVAARGNGAVRMIGILEGMLANTVLLESFITSSRENGEAKRIVRNHSLSPRTKSSRLHKRHVDTTALGSDATPSGVTRWLDEQQQP